MSGPEFKALRKMTGISQGAFSRLVGVSRPTVTNWEMGRRPAPKWAVIILRLLAAKRQAVITGQQSTLEL